MIRGRVSWRTWHLLVLFALGSVVSWLGESLRDWAGDRLKKAWFPEPPSKK